MSKKLLGAVAALAALAWSTSSAEAGFRHRRCAPTCAPQACGAPACVTSVAAVAGHYEDVVVERVIYAKEVVTESRTITVTECRPETRQRNYTVCKRVPYKETVTEEYTVMVQKTSMRKVTETVYKPVKRVVDQTYTVMVPHTEIRQGVQHVYECRPEQMVRTVCVDRGCWETREIQVPCYAPRMRCGGCGGCGVYAAGPCGSCGGCGICPPPVQTRCVRVWVPKYEYQQVPYTVMKPYLVAKPYQYNVTVCKPEQRTRQVTVCEQVAEQIVREVPVVTCVPEKKTRTFEVTRYKEVNETKTDNYTVMVPYQVQKTIQVPVVRCVPKTVQTTVRKWVCDPAPACAPGCAAPVDAAPAYRSDAKPTPAPAAKPTPAKPAAPLPVPVK
jgi:hypothetical protein